MTAHQIASGLSPSDADHLSRVLVRYECAEILLHEGQPVGLFKIARDGLDWHLIQIQLLPEFQGKGIGSQLIRSLALEARQAGASLHLNVLKSNPARRLYQRLGFTVVGKHDPEIAMVLTFTPAPAKG